MLLWLGPVDGSHQCVTGMVSQRKNQPSKREQQRWLTEVSGRGRALCCSWACDGSMVRAHGGRSSSQAAERGERQTPGPGVPSAPHRLPGRGDWPLALQLGAPLPLRRPPGPSLCLTHGLWGTEAPDASRDLVLMRKLCLGQGSQLRLKPCVC